LAIHSSSTNIIVTLIRGMSDVAGGSTGAGTETTINIYQHNYIIH